MFENSDIIPEWPQVADAVSEAPMSMHVKRTATILKPDQSRVLLRPFSPGDPQRVGRIISRIMSLPEDRVGPWTKSPLSSPSDTSRSAISFWNASNKSASCY